MPRTWCSRRTSTRSSPTTGAKACSAFLWIPFEALRPPFGDEEQRTAVSDIEGPLEAWVNTSTRSSSLGR